MKRRTKIVLAFTIVVVVMGGWVLMHWKPRYDFKSNVRMLKFELKKTFHRKPVNKYDSDIAEILQSLPDIDRSKLVKTLPVTLDEGYVKSQEYFEDLKKRQGWGYSDIYDVPEYLVFGDYLRAIKLISQLEQELEKGHPPARMGQIYTFEESLDNDRALLANYFAIHGDCDAATIYYSTSHSLIQSILNGKRKQDSYRRREFFILQTVGTAMLCDSQENAISIVENYVAGLPTRKDVAGLKFIKQDQFDAAQRVFLIRAYSRIASDLHLAGFQEQAKKYIDYAHKLHKKSVKKRGKDEYPCSIDIYRNMLRGNLFSDIRKVCPTGQIGTYLSLEYARNGDVDGVFRAAQGQNKIFQYRLDPTAIEILIQHAKKTGGRRKIYALLIDVEKRLKKPPYNQKKNPLAFMVLARGYAALGLSSRVQFILYDIDKMGLDYKVFPYGRELLRIYLMTSKSVGGVMDIYERKLHQFGGRSLGWGRIIAAAKKHGTPDDVKRAKRIKERDNLYKTQNEELDYYLEIGDLKSAENLIIDEKRFSSRKGGVHRIMSYIQGGGFFRLGEERRNLLQHYYLMMFP